MSEKIKTKEEKITDERDELVDLSKRASNLVQENPKDSAELGYKKYHQEPLAIVYDLAKSEDENRNTLKQNAQKKQGAFFANQLDNKKLDNKKKDKLVKTINMLAGIATNMNQEALDKSISKDELWLEKNETLEVIEEGFKRGLSLQEIVDSYFAKEKIAEAFKEREASFCCSDGRVKVNGSEYNKLGMAGGGILMFPRLADESTAAWLDRLSSDNKFRNLIFELHGLNVREVLSHEECGAARYACGVENGDDDGATLAKYIHFRLQTFNTDSVDENIAYKHLTLAGGDNGEDKMRNEIHDERMLLVDTTGRFNPDVLGLPSNFMVSSFKLGMSDKEVEQELEFEMTDLGARMNKELELLVGVANNHGFRNKRFTKDKPFYLFVVSDTEEHLEALKKCAQKVANSSALAIKVDGYVYKK